MTYHLNLGNQNLPLLTPNDSPCRNWAQKSVHNRVQNKCKPNAEIQNLFTSSYFSLRITGFHHEVHEHFTHPIIYNMRCIYRTGNLFNNAIIVTLPFNNLSTEGKVFPLLSHGRDPAENMTPSWPRSF